MTYVKLTLVLVLSGIFLGPTNYALAATSCLFPVTYSIGNVDTRFGLSNPDVQSALFDAEKVWETPVGRDVFSYRSTGGQVTVHMTYDFRQEVTNTQKKRLAALEKIKIVYLSVQKSLAAYTSSIQIEQSAIVEKFKTYQADEIKFNQDVAAANANGGASANTYTSLSARQNDLVSRFEIIKSTREELNARIARFNALTDSVNQLAQYLNVYIAQYNASLALPREYEEGVYTKDANSEKITIYEFADRNLLVRALAHELGHALGVGHVSDANALMYRTNTGATTTANQTDIAALSALCRL